MANEKRLFSLRSGSGASFTITDSGVELLVLLNNRNIRKREAVTVEATMVDIGKIPNFISGLIAAIESTKPKAAKDKLVGVLKQIVPNEAIREKLLSGWQIELK